MKLIPVLTEKSLEDAGNGKYTFWVDRSWNKGKISKIVEKLFKVNVLSVKTINYKPITKRNYLGRKRTISGRKKAIITLEGKDKIDLFETKK